ncbi:sugar phosphate nucleotidyltransferase [Lysinibacillus sp. BW-2-10]|uniref:sugar phosphate nucleotidyltransferase n=1 Tax=Lysinibacillus sp. BW-2-10 TaxID=2590030 RepID=UPI00117F32BA|nr:sugar phosphate nucleotidyltransferase [Lysinibacillus sp. BW-2-10]TSI05937.1 cupin domain-containing protein [Lysinibacillus sp. BW-2-10]
MKIILLCGGSGKRLWPLSNSVRSKQFLKVLKDQNGESESMIQRIWKQLKEVDLAKDTIIVSSEIYIEQIYHQLEQEIEVVIEPEKRDTFPAIALGTMYFLEKKQVSEDDLICVIPVDPYVDIDFFQKLIEMASLFNNFNPNVFLMGIKPISPSQQYGYIIPENQSASIKEVKTFREKPTEQLAKTYIAQGGLWNSGTFMFRAKHMQNFLSKHQLPNRYVEIVECYNLLPNKSYDYVVLEQEKKIYCSEFSGLWQDLGTWEVLSEHFDANVFGNASLSTSCCNTHVMNELDIPIHVIGINDSIVVASPDGILISDKKQSNEVKNSVLQMHRPMVEERRWGWYKVLDYTKIANEEEVLTKRICIFKEKNLSYQYHHHRSEVWTILKGTGLFILNNEMITVGPGDVLKIPPGDYHAIKAIEELEIIEVQQGNYLIEEDIIRLYTDWEAIEANYEKVNDFNYSVT